MNFIQKSIVQKKSIIALAVGLMLCFISSSWATDAVIDINTASVKELIKIPGIGKVFAKRILAYREKHGPFKQKSDIQNIKGIGTKTYAKIKDLICVTEKK